MYVTRDRYYSDGVTEVTSPFFTCLCPAGHTYWRTTPAETCDICGKKLKKCTQPDAEKNVKK